MLAHSLAGPRDSLGRMQARTRIQDHCRMPAASTRTLYQASLAKAAPRRSSANMGRPSRHVVMGEARIKGTEKGCNGFNKKLKTRKKE